MQREVQGKYKKASTAHCTSHPVPVIKVEAISPVALREPHRETTVLFQVYEMRQANVKSPTRALTETEPACYNTGSVVCRFFCLAMKLAQTAAP